MSTTSKPNLSTKSVYQQAWQLVKGSKAPIWTTGLLGVIAISIVMAIANQSLGLQPQTKPPLWYELIFLPLLVSIVMAPFLGGMNAIAIMRARRQSISPFQGLKYFDRTVRLLVAAIIALIITNTLPSVGLLHSETLMFVLRVVSFLLGIFLIFMVPLIVDKNAQVGVAFTRSIKLVAKHYGWILLNYAIFILAIFILMYGYVSLITVSKDFAPLGLLIALAMIWLAPLGLLMVAVMYTRLMQ